MPAAEAFEIFPTTIPGIMDAEKSPLFSGMSPLHDNETMPRACCHLNTLKACTSEIESYNAFFFFFDKFNLIEMEF